MKYSVSYNGKEARIQYFGDITEEDVKQAHFDLSGDERFYDCQHLVLDVTDCSLKRISVDKLGIVIATDLGASKTIRSMKVAFIANTSTNIAKTSEFIKRSNLSPWTMKVLKSYDDASEWLK